jgi:DNA-binding PadR family transcriptional regulator
MRRPRGAEPYAAARIVTVLLGAWMSMPNIILGLLEREPRHGYELRRLYDERFAADRSVSAAQIYAALSRLERRGRVLVQGIEPGNGPDRRVYAITEQGVTDLSRWLQEPEPPQRGKQNVLFAKVVLAMLTGRDPQRFLDLQRQAHVHRMRELTRFKRAAGLGEMLLADHALFHVEADLRWLEVTAQRLDDLREELA